jgi:aspartyl/asparaginyl-tRNA synthetase
MTAPALAQFKPSPTKPYPNYDAIVDSGTGCSVTVTGKLVASQGKGQDREIQADEVIIHGLVDDPESYPISKKQHSFEYLRGVAHLRPSNKYLRGHDPSASCLERPSTRVL